MSSHRLKVGSCNFPSQKAQLFLSLVVKKSFSIGLLNIKPMLINSIGQCYAPYKENCPTKQISSLQTIHLVSFNVM